MLTLFAALMALQPATLPVGERTQPAERLATGASLIPDEDPLIAAAAGFPLGSPENPVRVGGPEGEVAYLGRLRCADGSIPRIGTRAQRDVGAFGSLVAAFELSCAGAPGVSVVMDMYHGEHAEDRAPPGFAITPR